MESTVIEKFNGVYLLYCENVKFKGRTYIGYTVDPVRRLKRHNAGFDFGGAKKTSNKGPWNMVLIIHGFPNSRLALRFEWAWQHLDLSLHTRHLSKKKSNQTQVNYLITSVAEMLKVSPWFRLPLTIQWLDLKFSSDYLLKLKFPQHMNIQYGAIEAKKIGWVEKQMKKKNKINGDQDKIDDFEEINCISSFNNCYLCKKNVDLNDRVECVYKNCKLISHIICLGNLFTKNDKKILPINGICPSCDKLVLWGDIVRKKLGCYVNID
ncbi:structure-specific endonuclease subunit slx1 [Microplitis demolitor]|uniref:structure-specific endonuclease subunit slx1 n=1 Tax=Microplitis demolitor TaxID=69319 RepID=UPI0004400082|nr:structure-specific endonuclease subunit slx1 [Microplitis demolitor]